MSIYKRDYMRGSGGVKRYASSRSYYTGDVCFGSRRRGGRLERFLRRLAVLACLASAAALITVPKARTWAKKQCHSARRWVDREMR